MCPSELLVVSWTHSVFQRFGSFYFLGICTKKGLTPEHKHKEQVFDFIFLSLLLLIVCLYSTSCCPCCILIKVLFILRLSSVPCHSLLQIKPQRQSHFE